MKKDIITLSSVPGSGTYKVLYESLPDAAFINCATITPAEFKEIDFNKVVVFDDLDRAPNFILNMIFNRMRA